MFLWGRIIGCSTSQSSFDLVYFCMTFWQAVRTLDLGFCFGLFLSLVFFFLLAFIVGFLACVCKISIYLGVFYELVIFPFFWGTFDWMNFRTCCLNMLQYLRASALKYIVFKCELNKNNRSCFERNAIGCLLCLLLTINTGIKMFGSWLSCTNKNGHELHF